MRRRRRFRSADSLRPPETEKAENFKGNKQIRPVPALAWGWSEELDDFSISDEGRQFMRHDGGSNEELTRTIGAPAWSAVSRQAASGASMQSEWQPVARNAPKHDNGGEAKELPPSEGDRRARDDKLGLSPLTSSESPAFGDQPEPSELEHQLSMLAGFNAPVSNQTTGSAGGPFATSKFEPSAQTQGNLTQTPSLAPNETVAGNATLAAQLEHETHALASTSQENKRVVPTRVALKNKSKKIKEHTGPTMISYTSSLDPRDDYLASNYNGALLNKQHSGIPVLSAGNQLFLRAYQLTKQMRPPAQPSEWPLHQANYGKLGQPLDGSSRVAPPNHLGQAATNTNRAYFQWLGSSQSPEWTRPTAAHEPRKPTGLESATFGHSIQATPAIRGPFELEQFTSSLAGGRAGPSRWKPQKAAGNQDEPLEAATNKLEQNEHSSNSDRDEDIEADGVLEGDNDQEAERGPSKGRPGQSPQEEGRVSVGGEQANRTNETAQVATGGHSQGQAGDSRPAKMGVGLPTNELLVGPFKSEAEAPATITLAGVIYQKSGASQASLVQRKQPQPQLGSVGKAGVPSNMNAQAASGDTEAQANQAQQQWHSVASGPNIVLGTFRQAAQPAPGGFGPSSLLSNVPSAWAPANMPSQADQLALSASGQEGIGSASVAPGQQLLQQVLSSLSSANRSLLGGNNLHLLSGSDLQPTIEQHTMQDLLSQLVATASGTAAAAAAATTEQLSGAGSRQPATIYVGKLPPRTGRLVEGGNVGAHSEQHIATSESKQQQHEYTKGAPIVIVQKDVKPVKYHLLRAYLKLRRLLHPFEATYVFPSQPSGAASSLAEQTLSSSILRRARRRRRAWHQGWESGGEPSAPTIALADN